MNVQMGFYIYVCTQLETDNWNGFVLFGKKNIKARIFNLLKTKKKQNSTKLVFLEFVDGRYKGDRLETMLCNTLRNVFKIQRKCSLGLRDDVI